MFRAYARYWDFQGRANRAEYWLFFLWMLILGFIAGFVDGIAFRNSGWIIGPCSLFITFANLIPNLSLSVRRLHDIDRSAWWMLIGAIPLLGSLVLLVMSLMPGTPGENRFGSATSLSPLEALQETFA